MPDTGHSHYIPAARIGHLRGARKVIIALGALPERYTTVTPNLVWFTDDAL